MGLQGSVILRLLHNTDYVGELCYPIPALQQLHLNAPGQGQGEGPDQPDGLARDPNGLPHPSPRGGEPGQGHDGQAGQTRLAGLVTCI